MLMKKKTLFVILTVLVLVIAGCSRSSDENLAQTEAFESALETAVAETLAANIPDQVVTPEETLVVSTVPPLPTLTATLEITPTETPTSTPQTPCYRAELVEETVPDGSVFPPGKYFTKIWVIRNTGVCAWEENFRWVLVEGEDFNAPTTLKLLRVVNPNEELRVQMELKTPELEGVYKGTYKILTDEGGEVTPQGFWVTIRSQKEE